MVMSRDQNAGRYHNMKTDNSAFEKVEQFKYLGNPLTNQNSIQKKLRADIIQEKLSFGPKSFVFQFPIQK